ncbi:MAG: MFS transporter [Candidatus Helarchaeota archaeon]
MNRESKFFLFSYFIISMATPAQFIFAVKKADPFTGTLMVALYFITSAISSLVFSHLSDRMMKRKIFAIGGFLLSIIVFTAYFFATSPLELIMCAGFVGIGFSAYSPTSNALFSEMEPSIPRGKLMSYFFVVASAGWAAGSIIQGVINQYLGDFVFIFAAIVTIFGLLLYFIKVKDVPYEPDSNNSLISNTSRENPNLQIYSTLIFILAIAMLTRHLGVQGGFALFPNYLEEGLGADPLTISLILAANMTTQSIIMIPIGFLVDHSKVGRKIILLLGLIGADIAVIAWSLISVPWILIFPQMLIGFSWPALATSATAIITDITTRKTRSRGMGWFNAGLAFGGSIGPLIAAFFFVQSNGNFNFVFQILSIFPIIGILLIFFSFSENRATHIYSILWKKR